MSVPVKKQKSEESYLKEVVSLSFNITHLWTIAFSSPEAVLPDRAFPWFNENVAQLLRQSHS
ncbi:hypothetical protein N7520_008486 [Penicillium odoratum]|uniref:uncharacterized protein n=1 Tax=Penicillium odoratum TaxID=1167516 RepID=UPI002547D8C2|nr:uncharacterized protein N7520_008486 [Penicillium odoratum]KAJ5751569.1 hypothetical protein N7520_008486 [Penicillium odoratum]